MRELDVKQITETIAELCICANRQLPADLCAALSGATTNESTTLASSVMDDICANVATAQEMQIPICQDTGMAVIFIRLGQDVHLVGGDLTKAVNDGVSQGYTEGLLRCSVVGDPLRRVNTGDNTPAILHLELVPGEMCEITVAPKGFGSENMSRLYMLTPAANRDTIIQRVCETVRLAGSNACPPMVLGVGIGGDFEQVALLAKKALCRPISQSHPDAYYAQLEKDLLDEVNRIGIGPQGFGGNATALAVMIETAPTHIAGLPLAINVGCHVTRHASAKI